MSLEIIVLKFNVLKLVVSVLKFSACASDKIVFSACTNGGGREHSLLLCGLEVCNLVLELVH
jgi:hypothetical protein